MADEDAFDAIVVGGGFAGLAAAYRLAQADKSVLVVERGQVCGAKNLTGGRIYAYALQALLGDRWREAPVQREVKREIISLLTEQDAVNVDSTLTSVEEESYTVLAAPLLAWLAEQAEEAGAMIVTETTVDGLIIRDGRVCGVTTGDEQLEASVVIDCEGINPLLLERAGLIRPLDPHDVAVGAKFVFGMPAAEVEQRFGVQPGEGAALLGMGDPTHGVFGGVFAYTNNESVSLGLVVDSAAWAKSGRSLLATAQDLQEHPALRRYVGDAELLEYGAHLVYEGGYDTLPQMSGDGWLICGDAAGLCLNRGFTIRGMDYAVMSGIAAADTVVEAVEAGDTGPTGLAGYRRRLDEGLLQDFRTLRGGHAWMSGTPDLFTVYPKLAVDLMTDLYHVGAEPVRPVGSTVWRTARKVRKPFSTARSLLKGMKTL
ncbi:FAD-dependent oxidoreductase [Cellulomonas chengniuliangii]|uniref:FAD-dependent oxidoreductase n=1 Tax=Cellulomonas chengniuliangii TaxID=2968084 RepID=A0ABY5L216_9CELL|nr:FAD-dependent oxidoreductase [Cellulomonas chengniuliangii]MCC2308468.1 FAD-dependent oxidoreductase [Cellulomonas chengniuliangii]MCC2317485.1 FAD-dependent oxidoreductase [Cellulomonas chengniuliangii]UUI76842.1 FAD-dependent oxidoreductase [Cellulomonas chengniuliangii]